jgi:hypothetical protein
LQIFDNVKRTIRTKFDYFSIRAIYVAPLPSTVTGINIGFVQPPLANQAVVSVQAGFFAGEQNRQAQQQKVFFMGFHTDFLQDYERIGLVGKQYKKLMETTWPCHPNASLRGVSRAAGRYERQSNLLPKRDQLRMPIGWCLKLVGPTGSDCFVTVRRYGTSSQ